MTSKLLPIILIGALAAVSGCGSDDNSSSSDATAATTTAASSSAAPYGTYVRRMTKSDVDRTAATRDESGPNQEPPKPGLIRLVLAKGASQDVLKAIDSTDFTIAMDATADGDVLNLTSYVNPNKGAFCGPEVPAPASYTFKVEGSKLILAPSKADPCPDRDATLTGTWTKG